jgi:hypothetical protein
MNGDATHISSLRVRTSEHETDLDDGASKSAATFKTSSLAGAQPELPTTLMRKFWPEVAAALSPASFWIPEYVCPSGWIEHAPFAFWLCEVLRPRRFVELGTHTGYSYFSFCQAIDRLALGTTAYAIDTWRGDEHSGFYDETVFQSVAARNREKYGTFSTLIRSAFADALQYFEDGSIDLLHIDGRHLYNDVRTDFATWRLKLTTDAVVLFHDINVRERDFGVWKFFEEVRECHPSFQFFHGHGLGVLTPGERIPEPLQPLLQASSQGAYQIRAVYAALGRAVTIRQARDTAIAELRTGLEQRAATEATLRAEIEQRAVSEAALRAEIEQRAASEGALRAEIEQRAVSEAALRAEIEQRAASEGALRAEIEQRAASEAALRAEIEQRAASEGALRAEIEQRAASEAALRNAVDKAECEAQDWKARAEAVEADIATLRGELTKANQGLNERAAEAETLQAELKLARNNLAEAKHRESKHHSALTALQAEINSVRMEFDEAEQRRREGEAAAAAQRAEITSLRIELAAARDVGKAALDSLRITPAPILLSQRNMSWLGVMLRRFGRPVCDPLASPG